MNKVILMGRLTRDPEVRYSQGQNSTAIARFSIAVDRRFKRDGQPDTDFFNCTCFGRQAEFVEKFLQNSKTDRGKYILSFSCWPNIEYIAMALRQSSM